MHNLHLFRQLSVQTAACTCSTPSGLGTRCRRVDGLTVRDRPATRSGAFPPTLPRLSALPSCPGLGSSWPRCWWHTASNAGVPRTGPIGALMLLKQHELSSAQPTTRYVNTACGVAATSSVCVEHCCLAKQAGLQVLYSCEQCTGKRLISASVRALLVAPRSGLR